jgi:hypothetical protein
MITDNQIKEILSQREPDAHDMIKVIIRYIFDLKKEEIDFNMVNIPNDFFQIKICYHMFNFAKNYYGKIIN